MRAVTYSGVHLLSVIPMFFYSVIPAKAAIQERKLLLQFSNAYALSVYLIYEIFHFMIE